jgi:chemotaxis protein CheD
MSQMEIPVPMGALQVAEEPAKFVFPKIGSCVGLIVADPETRLAGCAHVMLPQSPGGGDPSESGKYADSAVKSILSHLESQGVNPARFSAAMAGAARFQCAAGMDGLNFAERVSAALQSELERRGISCVAQDLGGSAGRVVRFDASVGTIEVEALGAETRTWNVYSGDQP